VRKVLADIPLWKDLGTLPDRVKNLEMQVKDLEEKLNGKWPGDVCRSCGARALRYTSLLGPDKGGVYREFWECTECHRQEERPIKPR
jgi:hypothetical protein